MKGQYKVLCIGVNGVRGKEWKKLQYAEKSAYTAARYFEALKNKADVTLLTGKKATKTGITNWLNRCSAIPGELTVIIFFAGHASAEKNEKKETWERCLWLHNNEHTKTYPEQHQLKTIEMLKLLSNPLHQLMVIIDACYHLDSRAPIGEISQEFKESERMTSLKRYVIISSSLMKEYSFENTALRLGVLTYYFLRTLSGKYTFFLKRRIAFFKFLEILHNKVKNHGLKSSTRRNSGDSTAPDRGIMVHLSHKSFYLPILEPVPFIADHQKRFQEKRAQLVHFFTCTRLRSKIYLVSRLLAILLLLLYLVNISVVRIHFNPQQRTASFHNTLLGDHCFFLNDLTINMLGKKPPQELTIYLLKHNWIKALLSKLDGNGKILLQGNLLGDKIRGINEIRLMDYALAKSNDIFYWHPDDVRKLLGTLREKYQSFDLKKKQNALKLLTKLGKVGKETAVRIFDFKREAYQELRNLFLEHFYTNDFLEQNVDFFNPDDYLFLLDNKKNIPIPPTINKQLLPRKQQYLHDVSRGIPGSATAITNTRQMEEINDKLMILARFGSQRFREKASTIFKTALDPEEVFYLVDSCRNIMDKVWIMEQYFMKVENMDFPSWVWKRLLEDYLKVLPPDKQIKLAKLIVNNKLGQVPKTHQYILFSYLLDWDSQMITLNDWAGWLRKYHINPINLFYSIIDRDDDSIFPFLDKNFHFFKNLFTGSVFNRLYKSNKTKAISLAKKIFKISDLGDRVQAALFLYNKNNREYLPFIIEFLEKARDNPDNKQLLEVLFDLFHQHMIPLIRSNKELQESLKSLLNQPDFFYICFRTNIRIWPEEVIHRIVNAKIPRELKEGHRFLKMCEKLPERYRKRMLIKICKAEIHVLVKSNAESTLAGDYPREFLELAFNGTYHWEEYTGKPVKEAYQTFSHGTLIKELILSLKEKTYSKVDFICSALISKSTSRDMKVKDFQHILKTFNRPLERIVLRKLRYDVNKPLEILD